jgi:AhpD family alkylhydroperoxidase
VISVPRVPPVPYAKSGPLLRLLYWWARRHWGGIPEPFAVLAHHRGLLYANVAHSLLARASVLPKSVRDLAEYRAVWRVGCSWCVDFGAMMARLDGVSAEQLKQIDAYATSPAYGDDERAAIAYADAMTATPPEVSDEQVADLRRRFGSAGVVELTYQIALENLHSRMNVALGITEQGFADSGACRLPWTDQPADEQHTS